MEMVLFHKKHLQTLQRCLWNGQQWQRDVSEWNGYWENHWSVLISLIVFATEKPQSSMAFTFTHTSGEASTYACINDVVYAVILIAVSYHCM